MNKLPEGVSYSDLRRVVRYMEGYHFDRKDGRRGMTFPEAITWVGFHPDSIWRIIADSTCYWFLFDSFKNRRKAQEIWVWREKVLKTEMDFLKEVYPEGLPPIVKYQA